MEMKAAVLYEVNRPMMIETVQLDEPKDGEVLVRMRVLGRVRWIREDDDSVGVTFMQRSQGHNMKIQWALRQLVGAKRSRSPSLIVW